MRPTAEASAAAARGACVDGYLGVDGARLRYREQGQGAAVLLLHGWTLDLEVWEAQVETLRHSYHVIRFDRRGFGCSSGRPSIDSDVRDVGAVCAHFRLERVALVGMSQGCRAVLEYACEHPGEVSCVALDGPPEFDRATAGTNVALEPFRELVRTRGLAAFREQWLQHPLMQLRNHNTEVQALLERIVERYPGVDLTEDAVDAAPAALGAKLESLTIPALIITGEYDQPDRLRSADALARRMPAAARAVIPASGHLASLDNPDGYTRQLAAFLARYADPAS